MQEAFQWIEEKNLMYVWHVIETSSGRTGTRSWRRLSPRAELMRLLIVCSQIHDSSEADLPWRWSCLFQLQQQWPQRTCREYLSHEFFQFQVCIQCRESLHEWSLRIFQTELIEPVPTAQSAVFALLAQRWWNQVLHPFRNRVLSFVNALDPHNLDPTTKMLP